jgi:hypothetical protein
VLPSNSPAVKGPRGTELRTAHGCNKAVVVDERK